MRRRLYVAWIEASPQHFSIRTISHTLRVYKIHQICIHQNFFPSSEPSMVAKGSRHNRGGVGLPEAYSGSGSCGTTPNLSKSMEKWRFLLILRGCLLLTGKLFMVHNLPLCLFSLRHPQLISLGYASISGVCVRLSSCGAGQLFSFSCGPQQSKATYFSKRACRLIHTFCMIEIIFWPLAVTPVSFSFVCFPLSPFDS
jgi:hypothetical protein